MKDLIISLMVIVGGPLLYILYKYGGYDDIYDGREIRNLAMTLIFVFFGAKAFVPLVGRKSTKWSKIIDEYSEYIMILPVIFAFFFMFTSGG